MWIVHRKEIRKVTFRALALRRSESRNCGLCVVYIQKYGATLLVGACREGVLGNGRLVVYSQLSPCGHPAITDARYYGQISDPRRKL